MTNGPVRFWRAGEGAEAKGETEGKYSERRRAIDKNNKRVMQTDDDDDDDDI